MSEVYDVVSSAMGRVIAMLAVAEVSGVQQKINLLDFYVALTPKQEREIGQHQLMGQEFADNE